MIMKIIKGKKILVVIILAIIIMLFWFIPMKRFNYSDEYGDYKVRINTITKVLYASFYHSCSYVDCFGSRNRYFIKLTEDEYKKIMKLWNEKEKLLLIFGHLCENDKVFYESFEKSYEDSIEDYNKLDLNLDGVVTNREYGNWWLNLYIEKEY